MSETNEFLHKAPKDISKVLKGNAPLKEKWNQLTKLQRNEWICWIISVKREETRQNHIERMEKEVLGGKRRPCCFAGCSHRKKTK